MAIHNPKLAIGSVTYWRFSICHKAGMFDAEAKRLQEDIEDLGVAAVEEVKIASIYYVGGALDEKKLKLLGELLLVDPITQEYEVRSVELGVGRCAEPLRTPNTELRTLTIEVAYRPGVRDPVESSLKKGAIDLGLVGLESVHAAKEYTFHGTLDREELARICEKLLVNGTIQQIVTPENLQHLLFPGDQAPVPLETVHLLSASDTVLQRISMELVLSLGLEEMRAIQSYYRTQGREPTLIELETIAQTWSEHCKHKTFRAPVVYTEQMQGREEKRLINGLLKETIMRATKELNRPWCLSTFQDNAGVIEFDEEYGIAFKVETHNHPCALEPFGGASTGIGGVIRDILGTGLGAKPIASTDIFCFAPPDTPWESVPPGALHPKRVMKGVVSGVKDYGNKMGIPTVNGAVLFDERFLGNPLVYCGNVGLIPKSKIKKQVSAGMRIFLVGGATGRDGIHGATFSSLGLTTESEVASQTAVQIGDPITEKKLSDALLEARDQNLFEAVTDCGAGGLSSAVGELGAHCGAKVHLEKVPLKYAGLTPCEIWISESQERMVLAVAPEKVGALIALFQSHAVDATEIGEFTGSNMLELFFRGEGAGELSMQFLHEGVPYSPRPARWVARKTSESPFPFPRDLTETLLRLLGRWETCSKEWIIRQYDHEVQGGSALKPLVGVAHQGPSDAAVVRPRLDSMRGIAIANGINFRYGDLDPYWMALSNVDEAIRQVIAVGGSLDRIALLDNFCWGNPTRIEVLGSLTRAALGCYDAAKAFGTPFISGKDSLHNEYKVGEKAIQIPGTLLISSCGVIADVTRVISMDAKKGGNLLYIVGLTKREMGGSSYYAALGLSGGCVPQVDLKGAPELMRRVSQAIAKGLVSSAHDCSEGGLGVAAAEMAFAGGLGLTLDLAKVPCAPGGVSGEASDSRSHAPDLDREDMVLFSESPTRFLLEVSPSKAQELEELLRGLSFARIGEFTLDGKFRVLGLGEAKSVVETPVGALQKAWEAPFGDW